jgi:hypothetical protein
MQSHMEFQDDPAQDRRTQTLISLYNLEVPVVKTRTNSNTVVPELIPQFTYSNSIYTEFCVEFID